MLVIIAAVALLTPVLAAQDGADSLETKGGDVVRGEFIKLEKGKIHFKSEGLGEIAIQIENVARLDLSAPRNVRIRVSEEIEEQKRVTIFTRDGVLFVRDDTGERETDLASLKGINEQLPEKRPQWDLSARAYFSGTAGNTETFGFGFRFDIKRKTPVNEMKFFGEGNFLEDRELDQDPVRKRDYTFGYSYSWISKLDLSVDLTEDLFLNAFAGYHYRTITGFGSSYLFINQALHTARVSAALTYTYEDLLGGSEDRGYLGARFGAQTDNWWLDKSLHLRAKSELLLDFDQTKNVVVNSEFLLDYKFLGYFSTGILIKHSWDDLPAAGFERNDLTVSATLGIAWGGVGF